VGLEERIVTGWRLQFAPEIREFLGEGKTPAKDSCFFCLQRKGSEVFRLRKPAKWPWPIPDGAGFLMCSNCAETLGAEAIAQRVYEHARVLLATTPERN
jgi:hypothetical protein